MKRIDSKPIQHPLLFNGSMVQAILAGRKTQTRRLLLNQPTDGVKQSSFSPSGLVDAHGYNVKIPYREGDLIWVKETWNEVESLSLENPGDGWSHKKYLYRASPETYELYTEVSWRPSIHCPRRASRILLEITEVRVQQIQNITPSNAIAEGLVTTEASDGVYYQLDAPQSKCYTADPLAAFEHLWDSIYQNWKANPWVIALTFKVNEIGGCVE